MLLCSDYSPSGSFTDRLVEFLVLACMSIIKGISVYFVLHIEILRQLIGKAMFEKYLH